MRFGYFTPFYYHLVTPSATLAIVLVAYRFVAGIIYERNKVFREKKVNPRLVM